MNKNGKLKTSIIWIIRWIIFLPAQALIFDVWQLIVEIVSSWVWWFAIPSWIMFGPFLIAGTVGSIARICPNPKIGNFLLLGIFLVGEGTNFYEEIFMLNRLEIFIRSWADLCIIVVLVAAAIGTFQKTESQQ
tara:strand:+ start:225 stop:623 length:399 start_codon:yes stop_codon:yes gene_type:complete